MPLDIDHMPDDVFISVTEALAFAGEAMETSTATTLLVITLDAEQNTAVLGGDTTPQALETLRTLLDQLADRALESPEVLHITA